jgi:LacI family transcriptional regulator
MAAGRLHELVTGASPRDGLQVLSTELVLRASCGCPPVATTARTGTSSCDPHTV